ncbi:MAG: ATP-binding cassette domain-containing protein [Methylococcales bacterium]|nr:ATP-binding cassette domain-containing protein [Methylococcales bacterium]
MLNFKKVSLRRGTQVLFSETTFTIHKGQRVGLTGANGVGKSSLFAMIRGELQIDEGDFELPLNLEVAHVAQETPALTSTALDYVTDGDNELRQLQQKLRLAEQADNGLEQAKIHESLGHIEGYTAEIRASRLMSGLGFTKAQQQNAVNSFSGGWRMRLNLAQALMCRSDILLLDEPTNHLDLDTVIWLQDWLLKYTGTLLLVSHDRDFLDTITTNIVHIEQKQATIYSGNYSAFERMRAEKLAQQQSAYEKQQREIVHIQSFITRFKAKASKAKQAQSRVKSLEKMEIIAQAHVDSPFTFSFPTPEKLPNPLLKIEKATLGYDKTIILNNISLSIAPGDRLGLLGSNGAGKSTLIKVLAGDAPLLGGQLLDSEHLKIGYFAQHQLEQLHLDESPLWHLQQLDKQTTEKELRNFLGGFDFKGDKVLDKVEPFSGGEKARLVLALLVYQNPNLLLLDEPTNHLDLEMRHALSVALQDYQGAMVVVSHDRHLLRSVTDQFLLVADGKLQPFDGDLDDYRLWLAAQKKAKENNNKANTVVVEKATNSLSRKELRQQEAMRRKRLKPLTDAVKKSEKAIEGYQQQQDDLKQLLANPTLYDENEKQQLKTLLAQKDTIDQSLLQAEEDWVHAEEQLALAE